MDQVPLDRAATMLGVSRRRAQAMVTAQTLPAEKVGGRWLVPTSAIDYVIHTRSRRAGHPLTQKGAWAAIAELEHGDQPADRAALDRLRRRVQPRARYALHYVHPALLDDVRAASQVVLGGRDAAAAFGAPVDTGAVDVYIRASQVHHLLAQLRARPVDDRANLFTHVVDDEAWPYEPGRLDAGPWVAWLDLEDRQDRAADALLDRLGEGRSRG